VKFWNEKNSILGFRGSHSVALLPSFVSRLRGKRKSFFLSAQKKIENKSRKRFSTLFQVLKLTLSYPNSNPNTIQMASVTTTPTSTSTSTPTPTPSQRFGTFCTSEFLPSADLALSMTAASASLKRADVTLVRGAGEIVEVWALKAGAAQRRVGNLLASVASWLYDLLEHTAVTGVLDVLVARVGAPRYRLQLAVFLLGGGAGGALSHSLAVNAAAFQKLGELCASFAASGAVAGAARTSSSSHKSKVATPTPTPKIISPPRGGCGAIQSCGPVYGQTAYMALMCGDQAEDQREAADNQLEVEEEEKQAKKHRPSPVLVGAVAPTVVTAAAAAAAAAVDQTLAIIPRLVGRNNSSSNHNSNNNTVTPSAAKCDGKMFSVNLTGTRGAVLPSGKQKINGVPLVTVSAFSAASPLCGGQDFLASIPKPEFKMPLRMAPTTTTMKRKISDVHAATGLNGNNNKTTTNVRAHLRERCGGDDESAASVLVALATGN
jgi:hypothetical protein